MRSTLAMRAVVWLRRPSLDRSLASGANDSPLLRLRAAQLVSPASRAATADLIELALTETTARARLSDDGTLQRVSIALAHAELVWLVAALRTAPDPLPQAVAMALELVRDDASPLYRPLTATALRTSARQITAALLP